MVTRRRCRSRGARHAAVLLLLATWVASATAHAEDGTIQLTLDAVDGAEAKQGRLTVFTTLTSGAADVVTVHEPRAWTVTVDGEPAGAVAGVRPLSQSGHALALAIVVAADDTMLGQEQATRAGLLRLTGALGPHDATTLVFAHDATSVESRGVFGRNRYDLANRVRAFAPGGDQPRLLSGLSFALDRFADASALLGPNRAVLVVTTTDAIEQGRGLETVLGKIRKRVSELGLRVDTVALQGTRPSTALKPLSDLARVSGGRFFLTSEPLDVALGRYAEVVAGQHVLTVDDFRGGEGRDATVRVGLSMGAGRIEAVRLAFVPESGGLSRTLLLGVLIVASIALAIAWILLYRHRVRRRPAPAEPAAPAPPAPAPPAPTVPAGVARGAMVVLHPPILNGLRFDLFDGDNLIGRDPARSRIVLDDASVSKLHAGLHIDAEGRFRLADLGSNNGTWADGVLLAAGQSALVGRETPIRVGEVRLKLDLGYRAAPAETRKTKRIQPHSAGG